MAVEVAVPVAAAIELGVAATLSLLVEALLPPPAAASHRCCSRLTSGAASASPRLLAATVLYLQDRMATPLRATLWRTTGIGAEKA